VFPGTPDRKIRLIESALEAAAADGMYAYHEDPATERYPLALISPSTATMISSTFGQLVKQEARAEMHPDDASERGIRNGDEVRAFNDFGEVVLAARLTRNVRRGVVVIHKGWWARHTRNGFSSNALSPDTLSDIGDGACFNDARIQVARTG
jgi:anaerobic selenocysteine-containing dehydrogenase